MKRIFAGLLILMLGFCLADDGYGQTATQNVTITVQQVDVITVSGAVSITLNSAVAGQELTSVQDATTTYNLTTNGSNVKITGELDAPYASGIALAVQLAAPTENGASTQQTLSTTPADLVTGISNTRESGLTITYTASATENALPNSGSGGETKTVTFTITN